MRSMRRTRSAVVAIAAVMAFIGGSCTPSPIPGNPIGLDQDWQFGARSLWIEESNDCIPGLISGCTLGTSHVDEAYTLNIAFRVKLGVANSAQTWVAGSRNNYKKLSEGQGTTLHGAEQNKAVYKDVFALDLLDLVNPDARLEIFGTYLWAMEGDSIGVGSAAQSTANILKTALNLTVAAGSADIDTDVILGIVFKHLKDAFNILLANIPLFGLNDDVMGGGLYVGIGAVDVLAGIIDDAIAGFQIPSIPIPVLNVPPDIDNAGIFTMGGIRVFHTQHFDGDPCAISQCGRHLYDFVAEGESLS